MKCMGPFLVACAFSNNAYEDALPMMLRCIQFFMVMIYHIFAVIMNLCCRMGKKVMPMGKIQSNRITLLFTILLSSPERGGLPSQRR